MVLTAEQLKAIAIFMTPDRIAKFLGPINDTMEKFGITSPAAQPMFLAQIMHESGECRYTVEIASGEAYEGRKDLGNTEPGDGKKYKGRGLIQITGRANYAAVSAALGYDFVADPPKLQEPVYAAASAGWFWKTHGLAGIAEQNTEDAFKLVTKRINGGYNGLEDRLKYWVRAKKVLGGNLT